MNTKVFGRILDHENSPYKGAILRFKLAKSYMYQGRYIDNSEISAVTNSLGYFEVELPPSTIGGENFYYLKIILNKIVSSQVTVPESSEPLNFSDLKPYVPPYLRRKEIGDDC